MPHPVHDLLIVCIPRSFPSVYMDTFKQFMRNLGMILDFRQVVRNKIFSSFLACSSAFFKMFISTPRRLEVGSLYLRKEMLLLSMVNISRMKIISLMLII